MGFAGSGGRHPVLSEIARLPHPCKKPKGGAASVGRHKGGRVCQPANHRRTRPNICRKVTESMRRNLIIAGLILAFEAYVGDGLIGMGYGTTLVVVFVIRAVAEKQRRLEMFRIAVIYALMFVATLALISSNVRLAYHRAVPVISAVSRYHSERGHYPETLDELVPAYLPSIPHAGFTLLSRDFRYISAERPQLYFPAMFHGVFTYDFSTETWRANE